MTQLSPEVMTHVLVDYDGSTKFVTEAEYNEIMYVSTQKDPFGKVATEYNSRRLGKIKFAAYKQMCSVKDYYEQYPDKRPTKTPVFEMDDDVIRTPEEQSRYHSRMRQGIIRGLQQYCDAHPEAKNAPKILEEIKSGKRARSSLLNHF
jgi:hypothetical protein